MALVVVLLTELVVPECLDSVDGMLIVVVALTTIKDGFP